jgi:hypothetical protein
MEETTQVAAFNTRIEADVAAARLADAGIESIIIADNLGGMFPLMQMLTGGFKIRVLIDDAELAEEVLAEHFEPVDYVDYEPTPPAAFSGEGPGLEWTRSTRFRVTLFVVLTLLAALALVYSVTQGTL